MISLASRDTQTGQVMCFLWLWMALLAHPSRRTSVCEYRNRVGGKRGWRELELVGQQDGISGRRERERQIHPCCLARLSRSHPTSWHPFADCLLWATVLEVSELPLHWGGHASRLRDSAGRGSVLFNSEKTSLRGHLRKGHLSPRMNWAW